MNQISIHILVLIFAASTASAQISLTNQVMGTLGGRTNIGPNTSWSYTFGEAVTGTRDYKSFSLTQGFHQPTPKGTLQFELIFENASCPTSTDGMARIISLSGCTGPYVISWSDGSTGAKVDRLSPGIYAVTVTTPDCELSESFTIDAGPQDNCVLRFFNAFSPNGDAVNNTWNIENIHFPEYHDNEVEIFNRWGQIVWSGKNYNNADVVWDGTGKNGEALPDATYYFIARINGDRYKGYIDLTR